MYKKMIFSFFLALVFFFSSGFALAADAKGNPQAKCPVMSAKIDKKQYADYKGKRVYFCCASCKAEFQKDPEKYIKALEDQGITLEKAGS